MRAFEYLLYSQPVLVADLATVLYRDFGLNGDLLTIQDLIDIFAYEFGYTNEPAAKTDEKFQVLFSFETVKNWEEDWLETI